MPYQVPQRPVSTAMPSKPAPTTSRIQDSNDYCVSRPSTAIPPERIHQGAFNQQSSWSRPVSSMNNRAMNASASNRPAKAMMNTRSVDISDDEIDLGLKPEIKK